MNSFLFTIDIDSLYTNIDTDAGLKAVTDCFLRYPAKDRPEDQLLELLDINLRRNDFQFGGNYFLQVRGTAMGKRFAPSYANIYMAAWEESALRICPVKPLQYYRLMDDIWRPGETFAEFVALLNAHHASIKKSE